MKAYYTLEYYTPFLIVDPLKYYIMHPYVHYLSAVTLIFTVDKYQ